MTLSECHTKKYNNEKDYTKEKVVYGRGNIMRCPKCGSSNIQFIVNNQSTGPSFLWGCCGSILLGPFGILCSLCGVSNSHEEYWICNDCGKKFDKENSLEVKEKALEEKIAKLNLEIKKLEQEVDYLNKNKLSQVNTFEDEQKLFKENDSILKKIKKELISTSKDLKIINLLGKILLLAMIIIPVLVLEFWDAPLIAIIIFFSCGLSWKYFEDLFYKKVQEINPQKAEEINDIKNDQGSISKRMAVAAGKDDINKKRAQLNKKRVQLNKLLEQKIITTQEN